MVEIIEVKTKKQQKIFVEFINKLYKGCPYHVPAMYGDEMALFSKKKNPCFYESPAKYFLAYKDGKVVGRICGILCKPYNEKTGKKYVRFSRYDVIDDIEVSKALFNAVENFAKEEGMNQVHGPLGFNDFDKEGLVVEGFDYITTFACFYNFPYYMKHLEILGYIKEVDWLEYRVYPPKGGNEKIGRIAQAVLKRYKLKDLAETRSVSWLVKHYGKDIFALLQKCYSHLHGYVPISERSMKRILGQFLMSVKRDYICVVVNETGKLVAIGIALASISQALRKCKGKLFPFGFIGVLHALNHSKIMELALIAVDEDYRMKGVNAVIISRIFNTAVKNEVEYAETNLELESNHDVQSQWKEFDVIHHRRRRCYVKALNEGKENN